tara:strand:- start:1213 stop:1950 length:738 start_codon:yes stop_codon:yes gene_type:complete
MSKQVKLKFKKLLKKAEFVQADLEYHDELLPEAKLEFAKVVASILSSLSAEDQQKIDEHKQKAFDEMVERMKKESEVKEKESQEAAALVEAADDIKMNEEELEEPVEGNDDPDDKNIKIKKLFYKIADLTHPDKAEGRGVSVAESKRLERIFRKAKEAYSDLNWYVLYCIAIDLDIPVDSPTPQSLDWLEGDIRLTMGKISNIANLVVWIWYTGDANLKNTALASYLQQSFNYTWVPTLDPTETP